MISTFALLLLVLSAVLSTCSGGTTLKDGDVFSKIGTCQNEHHLTVNETRQLMEYHLHGKDEGSVMSHDMLCFFLCLYKEFDILTVDHTINTEVLGKFFIAEKVNESQVKTAFEICHLDANIADECERVHAYDKCIIAHTK